MQFGLVESLTKALERPSAELNSRLTEIADLLAEQRTSRNVGELVAHQLLTEQQRTNELLEQLIKLQTPKTTPRSKP